MYASGFGSVVITGKQGLCMFAPLQNGMPELSTEKRLGELYRAEMGQQHFCVKIQKTTYTSRKLVRTPALPRVSWH